MALQYNKDKKTYFATKKLSGGFITRIYFYKSYMPNSYGVALGIAKKKKDLNNWIFQTNPHRVDAESQYFQFGISVLVWAKKMIYEFIDNYSFYNLFIIATTNKRFRVYKKALKEFKEVFYEGEKMLIRYGNKKQKKI